MSQGGTRVFFFLLGGYVSRKRLGTAGIDDCKMEVSFRYQKWKLNLKKYLGFIVVVVV